MHTLFRIRCVKNGSVPKNGAVIICANHISLLDPLLIGISINRYIRFMAKSEFFCDRGLFVCALMKSLGAFPVKRSTADKNACRSAGDILKNGGAVGIFPQGKISRDNSSPMKAGAAMLSVKSGAPVVPVSIKTNGRIRLFSKISVIVGDPIFPPKNDSIRAARAFSHLIEKTVKEVSGLEYKGS